MGQVPAVPPSDRIRILIADHDRFFAEMLRAALAGHDEFDVVGIAGTAAEAVERTETLKPSVLVMDAAMSFADEIDVTRRLRELDDPPTVVLVTGEASQPIDTRAYEQSANAYVRRSQGIVSVIDVIVGLAHLGAGSA
jgi:two-component system, response regulator, stage 0 sporulation protein A